MDVEKLAAIFEAVQVLALRPSDILVFRTPNYLGYEGKVRIYTELEALTGHSRILIVDGAADVEILRFEQDPVAEQPVHRPLAGPPGYRPGKAPGAIS